MLKLKITDFNIFFGGGECLSKLFFKYFVFFFVKIFVFFSADLIILTIHEMLQQLI